MTDQQRALTWSGKWHIVNPDHPEARRYAIARCGAYVYRDDDPHYPDHLKRIKAGTKKSTGMCKLCTRSAGVKAVTVELPAPNCASSDLESFESAAWIDLTHGDEKVSVVGDEVKMSAPAGYYSSSEARRIAAALLAAAEAGAS